MSEEQGRNGRFFFERVFAPETPIPTEDIGPWEGETRIVGKDLPRTDAYERVSGMAQFTHDVFLPDMLYAAILRCPHPHAMVRSVDTSAAETMPGVRAVLTADSPGTDISWPHTPWLATVPKQSMLFDNHCRYVGEEVAAVAADTPQQARDALKAIEVDYEVLPFVTDEESALRADAPNIHESGNVTDPPYPLIRRGDVEAGFAEADIVLEETFTTSVQFHATMETHGSVVKWDDDKLTIWESTQGVFDSVMQPAADALQIPLNKIRAICKYVGGAFGSKAQLEKQTVIAALLSRQTARPVRAILTREEEFLCAGYRPNAKMTLKAGVKRDGTLTAFRLRGTGSPGAYYEWTDVGFLIADLYRCPNILTEESTYYINAGTARPMRAPGFVQGSWALEQMMDMLAEELDMDPVELRLKNIADMSQTFNAPFTSNGLRECLTEGAEQFGWEEARARNNENGHIRRGVGVASAFWGGAGGPPVTAIVRMLVDGSVVIRTGAMDIGTGTKTVACMTAAEELNMPLERIRIENADTDNTPFCYMSGGSRTLPGLIPAVRRGAYLVKQQLFDWAAEELGVPAEGLELEDNNVVSRSNPEERKSITELISGHQQWDIVGVGYRAPNPEGKIIRTFAVHFAEVEVNTRTGEIRVVRMLGANESGRVINRKTFDNQVFGGMTQGLGYALTEQRVLDHQTGKLCTVNCHDYKVPTALDAPVDHEVVAVDPHDTECNIVGCKGLGEPATIPTASAIANAIYNATGVRFTDGPVDPRRLLELLEEREA